MKNFRERHDGDEAFSKISESVSIETFCQRRRENPEIGRFGIPKKSWHGFGVIGTRCSPDTGPEEGRRAFRWNLKKMEAEEHGISNRQVSTTFDPPLTLLELPEKFRVVKTPMARKRNRIPKGLDLWRGPGLA